VKPTLVIEGSNIHDISSFYEEINRVFMSEVDWKLGANLDALNDMFYGAYGALKGAEPFTLVWQGMEKAGPTWGWKRRGISTATSCSIPRGSTSIE
jgi:RNAse (barnase) inhibitor barstar